MKCARGFVYIDMLSAMFMVGAMGVIVAVAVNRQTTALRRLDDSRAAVQDAEAVLIALQSGQTPPKDESFVWSIEPLADAAPVTSMRWVRVYVTVGRSSAELVGLAPAGGTP
jgi:hypothetical protein